MFVAPQSALSLRNLKPVNGQDAQNSFPVVEVLRKNAPLSKDDISLRCDPVVAFNELVFGLFLGNPPWCMEHLHEAGEISGRYQDVANCLRNSTDVDGYYRFQQAAVFLKKYEGMDKRDEELADSMTLEKWFAAETACSNTNKRMWDLKKHPITLGDCRDARLINEIREEIVAIIGDSPPKFSEVVRWCQYGPGTSLSHGMDELDAILKTLNPTALLEQRHEVLWLVNNTKMGDCIVDSRFGVENMRRFLTRDEFLHVAMEGVNWVDYERYATVPKSIWERRSIGVGASLATFIQQGYDGFIRQRLKGIGIDLQNQEPNRHLAFLGSLRDDDTSPCTIDLSDASSRIAYGLVAMVMPTKWFQCLSRQRARFIEMPCGEMLRQEKFSAMGNSLTFSLQTLIFSSIVRVVLRTHGLRRARWRCYGDDIIVPRQVYDEVVLALEDCGFSVNASKSFGKGFFKESCGADYFHGADVRPLYLKKPITDVCEAYKVLNLVALFAAKSPIPAYSYRRLYKYLLSTVPSRFHVWGEPSQVLDGYIWAPVAVLPRRILCSFSIDEDIPENWAYLRQLLTDSKVQSKVVYLRPYKVGWRLLNVATSSYKRMGIPLPVRQYRWARVLSADRRGLGCLQSALCTLFI